MDVIRRIVCVLSDMTYLGSDVKKSGTSWCPYSMMIGHLFLVTSRTLNLEDVHRWWMEITTFIHPQGPYQVAP